MKVIFIVAGVVTGTALSAYMALNRTHDLGIEAYVNADPTDSLLEHPDSALVTYFGLLGNAWQGVKVTTTTLTEYDFNPEFISYLPGKYWLLANPNDRQHEIENFYHHVFANFSTVNDQIVPRKQSSIYVNIVRQLNNLAQSKAKKRFDFIYSNLEENTAIFSVYKKGNYKLLKNNSDSVKKIFLRLVQPENLTGIKVYFIFQPQSVSDEQRFVLLSGLFKEIFEEYGAQVFIQAMLVPETNQQEE